MKSQKLVFYFVLFFAGNIWAQDLVRVEGEQASQIMAAFRYTIDNFPEAEATVTDVSCQNVESIECTYHFGAQEGQTHGTMVGTKELYDLVAQCKANRVSEISCTGTPVSEFDYEYVCSATCAL
ncbi:MAG TPA: hypothetical protein VM432_02720 [Bdellovibrionales bacterium]|jgi:hypothetical protein|nr:hypothetical protein [Bdellovibrionales bacterium]